MIIPEVLGISVHVELSEEDCQFKTVPNWPVKIRLAEAPEHTVEVPAAFTIPAFVGGSIVIITGNLGLSQLPMVSDA